MFNNISSQAHALINLTKSKKNKSKSKIISITSGKGGVGKSTFTANIGYLLSKEKKVLIIDADIGLANMQILLNIKPQYTINDYISNNTKLKDILLQTQYDNLNLLASKSGHEYLLEDSTNQFSNIIQDIKNLNVYDYILIDTGAGLNKQVQEFLNISDEIIAVTTTDPSAITDVYALMKMVSIKKEKLFLVFNQTKNFTIGQTITNSLISLANKNSLNKNFMVKYIGNIVADLNIATTSRLRKLYAKELSYSRAGQDIQNIASILHKEIK